MDFDPAVLHHDPSRRAIVVEILTAALAAVDPEAAVSRHLTRRGTTIAVAGTEIPAQAIAIVAFGKAAIPMAGAAATASADLPIRGLVVSPDHASTKPLDGFDHHLAPHPLPDERSVTAAVAALELVADARPDELVLFLVSGGGSALLEKPANGLSLEDLRSTIAGMLRGGVPIESMNTVRTHLSAIKGGRLAAACASSHMATLLMSDVSGRPPEVVASGPTLGDSTTYSDALGVLRRHKLVDSVPNDVIAHLEAGARGQREETPGSVGDHVMAIVADGAAAAAAAERSATARNIRASVATTSLEGEARTEAVAAVRSAPAAAMTVFAGETTVLVSGSGAGGRNQEAALAAAMEIAGSTDTVFAALGTDGVDGPTDAAGAIVDGLTVERGRQAGLTASDHLLANDSHPFLAATGDLLRTGPTGTNVGDLWLVWRR